MAYVRTVKTASGARAVQIVHSSHKGSRDIEHIGSAYDAVELELLKTVARQRLAAGQGEFDLGLDAPPQAGGPLPITASRMGYLWDALAAAYDRLGFADASGGDEVFRQLVLARIIEPTSKLDSLRVLEEAGISPVSYRILMRRLPANAAEAWRERLAALCAHHVGLGPATLLLARLGVELTGDVDGRPIPWIAGAKTEVGSVNAAPPPARWSGRRCRR